MKRKKIPRRERRACCQDARNCHTLLSSPSAGPDTCMRIFMLISIYINIHTHVVDYIQLCINKTYDHYLQVQEPKYVYIYG